MRTGLIRRHRSAFGAVEGIFEGERGDSDFGWGKILENLLRIVRTIIIAHSGMVTSDDKMCTAIITPHDGVQNRLARSAIAHMRRHHSQHRPSLGIVELEQYFVGFHPHRRRHVVALGLAYQRMKQETIASFKRRLLNILMRPMGWVTGLER